MTKQSAPANKPRRPRTHREAVKLTKDSISRLNCPEGFKQVLYPTKQRGLYVRAARGGTLTWVFYRKFTTTERKVVVREITLGRFPEASIEQARLRAEELNGTVGRGEDPVTQKAAEKQRGITYGELFGMYIDQYAKHHTKRWQDAIDNHTRHFARFDHAVVSAISRRDVQSWITDLGKTSGKHAANRNYDTMRAVFAWAIKKEIYNGPNPCVGVDRFKTKSRDRFLLPGDEFARFEKALNEEPDKTIRDFFWMSLYTGARRANVLAMRWDQINAELFSWYIPDTKNGDSQTIPLTDDALSILQRRKDNGSEWVFPSPRKGLTRHLERPKSAWARLLKRASIANLRIHDLRRTCGSYMAMQGVSTTIIGKALGHKSTQATAVYARLTQGPVRLALQNAFAALADPSKLQ